MYNSAEQQTGSLTAWFSAQGPKMDSTHWHYRHSSLGQPRTHCHHTPYATIRECGKEQMDWYSVRSAFASLGNVHKTLSTLYMHTQYSHAWMRMNRDTQLQIHKGTIVCTANTYITAPFRYTWTTTPFWITDTDNNCHTLLWQPSTLHPQGSNCTCRI